MSGRRHSLPRVALAPFSPASAGGNAPGFSFRGKHPDGSTAAGRTRAADSPDEIELRSGDAESAGADLEPVRQSIVAARRRVCSPSRHAPVDLRASDHVQSGQHIGILTWAESIGPMSPTRTSSRRAKGLPLRCRGRRMGTSGRVGCAGATQCTSASIPTPDDSTRPVRHRYRPTRKFGTWTVILSVDAIEASSASGRERPRNAAVSGR